MTDTHRPVSQKNEWELFFNQHAAVYDDNVFTTNTVAEVDFLIDALQLTPGDSVLDVGCGTGRHAVELASRGYAVTGIDLSAEMLTRAQEKARAANVEVELIPADASCFSLDKKFDGAICLCEGAFGLLSSGDDPIEQPLRILRNISGSLKLNAKALFTMLNGLRMIRSHSPADVAQQRFDPMSITTVGDYPPAEGLTPIRVRQRGFIPTELALLFRMAGIPVIDIWGGTAGNWGKRIVDLDEMEIMVLAEKA